MSKSGLPFRAITEGFLEAEARRLRLEGCRGKKVFPYVWCFIISKASEPGKVERVAGTITSI